MSLVYEQTAAVAQRTVTVVVDPSYEPFVGKLQKAKTRKNKEYFVLRVSVPKRVAENLKAGPGDYLFFRTKKAEWFHMLDWDQMKNTWNMLPGEVKQEVYLSGLVQPPVPELGSTSGAGSLLNAQAGSTSPAMTAPTDSIALDVRMRGGV